MLLEHENMKAVSITSASVFIFFEFIILFFLKIKDPSLLPSRGESYLLEMFVATPPLTREGWVGS
jgi:hypothetical protein